MMSTWSQSVRIVLPVVLLFALFVSPLLFGQHRRTVRENTGEAAIRRALTGNFSGGDYHLLNNITLPFEDGTTQIDHVLVSRYGIFVIEAKHYTGWIFANAASANWTQVIFRFKKQFQNPLRQNYKHVKAIQKLLDFVPPEHVHSLVAFTGDAEFKTGRPEGVCDLAGLLQHVEQYTTEVLSENRLQFCVGRLECLRKIISGKTDVEHQEYLRQKYGDLA
jgi:hypothetical protein